MPNIHFNDLTVEEQNKVKQYPVDAIADVIRLANHINKPLSFNVLDHILVGSYAGGFAENSRWYVSDYDIVILIDKDTFIRGFKNWNRREMKMLKKIFHRKAKIANFDNRKDVDSFVRGYADIYDRTMLKDHQDAIFGFSLIDGTEYQNVAAVMDKFFERKRNGGWQVKAS